MDSSVKERYCFIDNIKAFAIICVVVAHVAERYLAFEMYPNDSLWLKLVYKIVYSFHMPLFMIISGYLYMSNYFGTDRRVMRVRFKTQWINLAIVYICFSIFAFFSKILFSQEILVPIEWNRLLFVFIEPIGYLWYIYILLVLYIVNIFVVRKLDKLFIWVIIFLCLEMICTFIPSTVPSIFARFGRFEFYFFIGIILKYIPVNRITNNPYVICALILALICEVIALHMDDRPDKIHFLHFFIAYGISIFLFAFFQRFASKELSIGLLGKHCLEVYLLHQYPLTVMRILFEKMPLRYGAISIILSSAMTFFAVGVFTWGLYKLHLHKLLFKPYTYFIEKR